MSAAAISVIRSASEAGSVVVTADLVGTVDQRGIFTVAGTDPFTYDFPLVEVDGEWRISDPPEGLVILETDFERLYDPVDAYFLDPTLRQLVPDPRYLIGGESRTAHYDVADHIPDRAG